MKYEVRMVTDSVKTIMGEPRIAGCVHQITIINKKSDRAAKREASLLHPKAKGSWADEPNFYGYYKGDFWVKRGPGTALYLTRAMAA